MLRLLSELGDAVFITGNPQYLAGSDDGEAKYYIGNATIVVTQQSVDKVFEDTDWDAGTYDTILYDCEGPIPFDAEYIVHIMTMNERVYERELERIGNFPDVRRRSFIYDAGRFNPYLQRVRNARVLYAEQLKAAKKRGRKNPGKPAEFNMYHLKPQPGHYDTVNRTEYHQQFFPFKDDKIVAYLGTLLGDITGLSQKSIADRLKREWVTT
jgi:hypothetical protein